MLLFVPTPLFFCACLVCLVAGKGVLTLSLLTLLVPCSSIGYVCSRSVSVFSCSISKSSTVGCESEGFEFVQRCAPHHTTLFHVFMCCVCVCAFGARFWFSFHWFCRTPPSHTPCSMFSWCYAFSCVSVLLLHSPHKTVPCSVCGCCFATQIPLRDALLLHEVLEDHAQDLKDALGMYSKASSGGAVTAVRKGRTTQLCFASSPNGSPRRFF